MEKRLTWCSEIGVGGVLTFIASVIWYGKTELDCDKYRKKINAKSKMTQVSRPRIKLIAQFCHRFSLKPVLSQVLFLVDAAEKESMVTIHSK